ncbi:MAG: tetratricopeptide repeat protein [Polyangiaceae bacterium]
MNANSRAILVVTSIFGVVCPGCGQSPEREAPRTEAEARSAADADAPNGVCPAGSQVAEHVGCVDEGLEFSTDALESCRSAGEAECDQRCQNGDAPSCTALALVHLLALEATPNTTYAGWLFDKACAAGDGMACNDLGRLHARGIGFPVDVDRAETLYSIACEHGTVEGCVNLATARAWGQNAPENVVGAALSVKQACTSAGDARSCAALGWMLERGSVLPRDERIGVVLYTRACDEGDQSACDKLGRAYLAGAGVKPDDVMALSLFRRACDHARSDACTDLATMYCLGRGVPRDRSRSAVLFQQACEAGDVAACRANACSSWAPM